MEINSHKIKAQALLADCEKKLQKYDKSIFKKSADKYESVGDDFVKAAQLFHLAKDYNSASQSYLASIPCFQRSSFGGYKICNSYVHAATAMKFFDLTGAAATFLKAIALYAEEGKWSMAAKYETEVGEIFETTKDNPNAIKHYCQSAEYYEMENSFHSASSAQLKAAHLAAEEQNWLQSAELFISGAKLALSGSGSNTMRHIVKDYYLKAGLVYLRLGDVVAAEKMMEKTGQETREWQNTREWNFLASLISAVKDVDGEAFQEAVQDWQSTAVKDPFKDTLMLKIAESFQDDEEDLT